MASTFTPVNSRQDQVSLVEIDPRGDVYFVLAKTTLRVSSKVLCLVSDVFCAMFLSENFVEGETLSKEGTCRVSLPTDDPKAMQAVCLILHHRPALIDWDITINVLEDIAILADKYACAAALSLWAHAQMASVMEEPIYHSDENCSLLYIAYTLDLAAHFTEISKRMVFAKHNVSCKHTHKNDLLPCGILSKPFPKVAFLCYIPLYSPRKTPYPTR